VRFVSFASLVILLISACIHVVAHVALKRARDRTAMMWWFMAWGTLLYLPVVFFVRRPLLPDTWLWIGLSSIFEAGYFWAIAQAYRGADLSTVYPLARGVAPVFLLVWSGLILREDLTAWGIAGVALIAVGLYLANLSRFGAWSEPWRALRAAGPRWALLAGLFTSLYTAVDKVGIRGVEPLLYTYLALATTTLWLTPLAFIRVGWQGLARELRASRWAAPVAGVTTLAAYALVLYAMQLGTPAGYAGAVREVSVVLGAGIGVWVFRESGGPVRVIGAALVAAGVVVIGLLG
jgi:drug/metabolite transporter (DMT)-like permease